MARASVIQATFNAGELSPKIEGRVDLQKYSNGAKLIENFLLTAQGPAVRRGGSYFVGEVKDSSAQTWMLKFEFNSTQAYILEFGNLYVRLWANHGQVIASGITAYAGGTAYTPGQVVSSGGINYNCLANTTGNAPPNAAFWYPLSGVILELPTPYTTADLIDADGTLKLRFAQTGDVVYIAHPTYPLQTLTRFGASTWAMAQVVNFGGPFKTTNADITKTVYGSALTGNITLTANSAIFTPAMVGSLFYLKQSSANTIPNWSAGLAWSANSLSTFGGANYLTVAGGTSGGKAPVHSEGSAQDGDPGVLWVYQDNGSGIAQITAYTSPTLVSATVLTQLPSLAVSSGNPTSRWAQGSFNATDGYPSNVTFFRERLTLGAGQQVWMSVTGDYQNFNRFDEFGAVQQNLAISITMVARKVNSIAWFDPGPDLIIGTAGGEFSCAEMTQNQVFGPSNVTVRPQSGFGSKGIASIRIGNSVLYVQRSGRKVRELSYDAAMQVYKSTDISILAEHVSRGITNNPAGYTGLLSSDFQQEPNMIVWYPRSDGMLVGLTFNREQDVVGFHRHPIGGNGAVESVACISSPDGSRDELWMIVNRTINGVTRRYMEYIVQEHQDGDDIEQAFYVDAGLTYDGKVNATLTPGAGANLKHTVGVVFTAGSATWSAGDIGRQIHYRYQSTTIDASGAPTTVWMSAVAQITAFTDATHVVATVNAAFPSLAAIAASAWRMTVTSVSGYSYLANQTVDILVNGAPDPQQVMPVGGTITMSHPGSVVTVGLPAPCRLWTMRMNAGAQDGTSQGKTARINRMTVRLQESLGLQYGPDSAHLDNIDFRYTGDLMDTPSALFSGDQTVDFPADYSHEPRVYVMNEQPLPTTVIAIMPQVSVYDR